MPKKWNTRYLLSQPWDNSEVTEQSLIEPFVTEHITWVMIYTNIFDRDGNSIFCFSNHSQIHSKNKQVQRNKGRIFCWKEWWGLWQCSNSSLTGNPPITNTTQCPVSHSKLYFFCIIAVILHNTKLLKSWNIITQSH